VDDATLAELYRRCRALIHPQREDFGMIAVEAQAAGRPVIAFGQGGVLDTVRPLRSGPGIAQDDALPVTGLFFDRQDPIALEQAIQRFEKAEFQFRPARLRAWAEEFSPERFDAALDVEMGACLGGTTG
jgi:glycosyltransferase involved in cell wall biosynthesis